MPESGGTFQFNESMLYALSELPRDQYEIVAAYTYEGWATYLEKANIPAVACPRVHWAQELGRRWKNKNLSYKLWKELTGDIHPIGKLLQEQHCDLWVFPSEDSYSFQLDVPALATIQDTMHRHEAHFPEVSGEAELATREWIHTNMVKHTVGILVDSAIGKQHVIDCYNANPDQVFIHPFIAPTYIYDAANTAVEDIEFKHTLPEEYLFYPAQFWEHKNHKAIVRAVHLLKQQGIDVHFVFVGSHKWDHRAKTYSELVALIEEYGLQNNFTFMGYVDDCKIPLLYKYAKGMVMPTFFGPTNIPPLEAFLLECPVAISGIYAMPEQLGDAALLFDPNSVEELAECIRQLWTDEDLRKSLIKKGIAQSKRWGKQEFRNNLAGIIKQLT